MTILQYFLLIVISSLLVYLIYLIITKAFKDIGFSAPVAIIIVLLSFLFGFGLLDGIGGITYSNIPLFTYNTYWQVGINVGGAIIPILLSIYLSIKNRLQLSRIFLGIAIVALVTYLVTYPKLGVGIVSEFPFWLLPIFTASMFSMIIYWTKKEKSAPFAYVTSTLGVLIGADCFHLMTLLNMQIEENTPAVIGGASVFDMIFIAGILAVIVDGIFLYQGKRKEKK